MQWLGSVKATQWLGIGNARHWLGIPPWLGEATAWAWQLPPYGLVWQDI